MVNNLFFEIFNNIILWWPWVSFWSDLWFVQFVMIYIIYLMFSALNPYYVLLYMFLEIFFFGIFISIYQMELFTGFLWVTECTVVFVSLLLLFYLNVEGNQVRLNLKIFRLYYSFGLFVIFSLFSIYSFCSEFECYTPLAFNFIDLWDDYYEALYNVNSNDFTMLTISYYSLNSAEFIFLGLLLLVGSVVCVHLNKAQKSLKVQKYNYTLNVFDFFKDFVNYVFMRKQNLNDQTLNPASLRLFKKKKSL